MVKGISAPPSKNVMYLMALFTFTIVSHYQFFITFTE